MKTTDLDRPVTPPTKTEIALVILTAIAAICALIGAAAGWNFGPL